MPPPPDCPLYVLNWLRWLENKSDDILKPVYCYSNKRNHSFTRQSDSSITWKYQNTRTHRWNHTTMSSYTTFMTSTLYSRTTPSLSLTFSPSCLWGQWDCYQLPGECSKILHLNLHTHTNININTCTHKHRHAYTNIDTHTRTHKTQTHR